jgi:hypothetical protein
MPDSIDAIETLIKQGRYFEARAKLSALPSESTSIRTKQLYALAMSKCGVPEAAMQFLEPIYKQSPDDPETAGILGGIYKEIFIKTKDQRYAILSKDTYFKNFTATKSYYTGINAATMSAISGQSSQAKQIAGALINLLDAASADFWEIATLAEAQLLLKDRVRAKENYLLARNLVGTDWGKVNSIYNQLWLLNHYLAVSNDVLKIFKPPVITAFVGHMIDHPSRVQSRFPASIEHNIKEALRNTIVSLNAKIGYCSLACGGDILFAEAMVETGGELNLFLPFASTDFVDISVRFAGEHWVERFEALTKKFPVTFVSRENYEGYNDLFHLQSGIIFGATSLRGHVTHTKPHLITVMSGLDLKRKEGGTLDTLSLWPFSDTIVNVNPDNFNTTTQSSSGTPAVTATSPIQRTNRPALYLLMADFPKLSAEEKETFWKFISDKLETQSPMATACIWNGDTLMAAYRNIKGSLELCHDIQQAAEHYHKKDSARIGLHVGPVYIDEAKNTLGKKMEGMEVNVLTQLHSYATIGGVYASSGYAMELALDLEKYALDYAGKFEPNDLDQSQEIYRVEFIQK